MFLIKKILFTAMLSVVAVATIFAQKGKVGIIKAAEGDVLEKSSGIHENAESYLGKDAAGNLLFYATKTKINMAGDDKITETLVSYDDNMHVVKRTPIKNEAKKVYGPKFFNLKNKFYFANMRNGKTELEIFELDVKTATIKGTPIATIQTGIKNTSEFFMLTLPIFSPDSSFLMIKGMKNSTAYFIVFDAQFKIVGTRSFNCGSDYVYSNYFTNNAVLDNASNIYALKMTEIDKKQVKARMISPSFTAPMDYTCIKLDKTGTVSEQILALDKKYLNRAKLAISEDVLVVGALYGDNVEGSIGSAGLALLILDNNMKTIKTTLKALSDDILKKGKDGKKIIDGNFIEHICITKNNIFLVCQTPNFTDQVYSPKIVALFTDIGDLEWVKQIDKTTTISLDPRDAFGISAVPARNYVVLNDAIVFITPDNAAQRETGKRVFMPKFGSGIVVATAINTKGEVFERTQPYNTNVTSVTPAGFWVLYYPYK